MVQFQTRHLARFNEGVKSAKKGLHVLAEGSTLMLQLLTLTNVQLQISAS